MKKFLLYSLLFSVLPVSYFTGGAESPFRFLFYPLIAVLTIYHNSKGILQTAVIFSLLYALMPLIGTSDYPFFHVIVNVAAFLIMSTAAGLLADRTARENHSSKKTIDSYQALMNNSNLQIMNLETKIESLSQTYERLKESDANKTQFFANISHEMRSPLTSILSFSEILLNYPDVDNEQKRDFVGIINEESRRLTQLINEILDLTRIASGKFDWQMNRICMEEIIRSAVKIAGPQAESKGIPIEMKFRGGDLSAFRGDRGRILQVVLNLLTNAIKFTSNGKITVGIEDVNEGLKVFVRDTGEGIYPEEREKIFEEFYRIGDNLTGRPKGSGLGLSISKSIIEAHKGRIWVESEIGKGSTFFFTVPYESHFTDHMENVNARSQSIGGRILVVEKFVHLRQALRLAFEGCGYSTIGLCNTRMAVDLLRSSEADAILIGYNGGHEHFDELTSLARRKGVSIYHTIVISDAELGAQVAVNGYISRLPGSFETDALSDVIGRQPRRIMVISGNSEDARNLQLLIGSKGYDTEMASDATLLLEREYLPDAVIVDSMSNERVYMTLETIRSNAPTRNIPVILNLNVSVRDLRCIGLGRKAYGGGLATIVEGFHGEVCNVVHL